MKIFRILGIVLTAVLMCANSLSCSNNSNKTICYETIDGDIIRFENEDVFGGAKIISNTYSTTKGYGTMEFASEVTAIETEAFYGCKSLTSITIPNSVVSIGESAFMFCDGLTSVTIPNSVTSIGDKAFTGCSGLTSVTIPNSVTSIGHAAFINCDGLTSVTIPNSVTSIGGGAFLECYGLTSVTIGNSVRSIDDYAFCNCDNLMEVYVLAGSPPAFNSYVLFGSPANYSNAFSSQTYEKGTLYVPEGSVSLYESTAPWSSFSNIKAIPEW